MGEADWARARVDFEQGRLSVGEIAERHGIAASTFYRRRVREGWSLPAWRLERRNTLSGATLSDMLNGMIKRESEALARRLERPGLSDEERLGAIRDYAALVARNLDIQSKERQLAPPQRAAPVLRRADDASREKLARLLERIHLGHVPKESRATSHGHET